MRASASEGTRPAGGRHRQVELSEDDRDHERELHHVGRSPHRRGDAAAALECYVQPPERAQYVGQELQTLPGEDRVERPVLEPKRLGVGFQEVHVVQASGARALLAERQQIGRDVGSHHAPAWRHARAAVSAGSP